MKYKKVINVQFDGDVIAEVHEVEESKGRRVGLKRFTLGFFAFTLSSSKAVEKNCIKAHAWADERIEVCEKYEV